MIFLGLWKEKAEYDEQRQEIIDWAKAHGITLTKELDHHFTKEDYRDGIHLNEKGQRKVAKLMKPVIWREQRK